MFLRLRRCFCNKCSVRTGTLVILWIELVLHVLGSLAGAINFIQNNYEFSITESYYAMVYAVFEISVSILAINGVEKKRPSYMLPSIIINEIRTVLSMLYVLFLFDALFFDRESYTKMMTENSTPTSREQIEELSVVQNFFVLLVITLLIFPLSLYFSAIVISHYKDLKDEMEQEETTNISRTILLESESDILPLPQV